MKSIEQYSKEIIEHINKLPPMPANILKLRKICANPYSNFSDLTPIIDKDPGLCADILHMANSAFYGVGHKVVSANEAVRYIGMDHLVNFVSIQFSTRVIKKHFHGLRDLNNYFIHSQKISLAAKILAKMAAKNKKEQDFYQVSGLLHDIGRLVILYISDEETAKLIVDEWQFVINIVEKEKKYMGMDHCYIGMKICEKWNFPPLLQDTIEKHHSPLEGELCEEAAFILLAHFISMDNLPEEVLLSVYQQDILERLNLSHEAIINAKKKYFLEREKA